MHGGIITGKAKDIRLLRCRWMMQQFFIIIENYD